MGASNVKLKGCLTHLTVLFLKCKFLCLLGFYSNAIVNQRNDFLYRNLQFTGWVSCSEWKIRKCTVSARLANLWLREKLERYVLTVN